MASKHTLKIKSNFYGIPLKVLHSLLCLPLLTSSLNNHSHSLLFTLSQLYWPHFCLGEYAKHVFFFVIWNALTSYLIHSVLSPIFLASEAFPDYVISDPSIKFYPFFTLRYFLFKALITIWHVYCTFFICSPQAISTMWTGTACILVVGKVLVTERTLSEYFLKQWMSKNGKFLKINSKL